MKAYFRKHLSSLVPSEEKAEEMLSKIKHGDYVLVEVKRQRNPFHHRKFFALLNLVFKNQEHYQSVDDLLDVFKLRVGHAKVIETRDGVERVPKSISFGSMSQDEFEPFYEKCVDFLIAEVIPGLDRAELEREVMEMLE